MKPSLLDQFSITANGVVLKKDFIENSTLPASSEISICEKWLSDFAKPQSRYNNSHSSYGLKHKVEEWAGTYISNGAFIFAAHSLGFPVKVIENGPNAYFGMKLLTPGEKWKHVCPSGFSKWLFTKKKEKSAVGELSRDAIVDPKWPRNAKYFIEIWEYLNSLSVHPSIMKSFNEAWEQFSGLKAPAPNDDLLQKCELFYENECDSITYQESYENAPDGYTYIYVLYEEKRNYNTKKVRYVGQTVCPTQRMQQHMVSPGNLEKVAWVGGLLNKGKKPKMAIIDCVPINKCQHMERLYINSFIHLERDQGQHHFEVLLNRSMI